MLFPVIMLILALCGGVGYFIYFHYFNKPSDDVSQKSNANLQINIKDITANEIITLDNKVISVMRIESVNIDLFTMSEKQTYINRMAGALSSISRPYKLLSIPRPFDVQPIIDKLQEQKQTANDIQKRIINAEISHISSLGTGGTITDRQFYIMIWDNSSDDYIKNRNEFMARWNEGGADIHLLDSKELIKLCNVLYNPAYSVDLEEETNATFPILR